jgi:nitrate reductase alpha subunit
VIGFSPIPAMSMVSYAAGSRYLSLLGGVCMSFYDWYCDLPPASPQTWGEQTDVPESADWYNAGFLILWGSNVPADAHARCPFLHRGALQGRQVGGGVARLFRGAKFADLWLHPKQGTDAALAMAMGHVILRSSISTGRPSISRTTAAATPTCRCWCAGRARTAARAGALAARLRLRRALGETNNPEWKTVAIDETTGRSSCRSGSIGYRWGEQGKWNLEQKDGKGARRRLADEPDPRGEHDTVAVAFPYFGNREHDYFEGTDHRASWCAVPAKKLKLADGEALVATVFDLFVANYGLDRGLGGANSRQATTRPALHAGLGREDHRRAARPDHRGRARIRPQRRKDQGPSMVILGAG